MPEISKGEINKKYVTMVSIVSMHCTSVTDIKEDEKTDSNHRTAVRYTGLLPLYAIKCVPRVCRAVKVN